MHFDECRLERRGVRNAPSPVIQTLWIKAVLTRERVR